MAYLQTIGTSTRSRVKEIVFLGTGTSSCIPVIGCLMQEKPTCKVCISAASGRSSKNCRLNVSSIIRYEGADGKLKNILIDCGKTFYTAARRWIVTKKIGAFEGVLLTHGHADAILGLDDLRHWTAHGCIQEHVDVYCDEMSMRVVEATFPYLVDRKKATGGGFVTDLRFSTITDTPMRIGELEIEPIYVEHGVCEDGGPFMSLGFIIDNGRIVYISDVSRIPEETLCKIQRNRPDILILDCLRESRPYKGHFILAESLEAVEKIKPHRCFFVGMTHDIEHDGLEEKLRSLSPLHHVNLAYDGLVLRLEFDEENEEISSV